MSIRSKLSAHRFIQAFTHADIILILWVITLLLFLGLCLGWYGQWTVADKDSCLTGWCCHPVDDNGNYVNLWDELKCFLNFASRFIYVHILREMIEIRDGFKECCILSKEDVSDIIDNLTVF